MTDEFRLGDEHATDISRWLTILKKRFPGVPLFLIGTSRGTISAAALAVRFGPTIAGTVLTSSMFRAARRKSKEPGPGLSKFDFATIQIPLLFVHHVSDQCAVYALRRCRAVFGKISADHGVWRAPPHSGPCDAFSQHGYLGKESETVEQIVNWMLKKPFQHEVK